MGCRSLDRRDQWARARRSVSGLATRSGLQVGPAELRELLEGMGWRLSRALGLGPSYIAIIDDLACV
jgi:hypothetical protein